MFLKFLITVFVLCFYAYTIFAQYPPQYYAELVPYRKGNLWGFCDWRKKIIVKPEYQDVKLFINELAKVKKNNKWGLIDQKGEIFLPTAYDLVYGASKQTHITVYKGTDKSGHQGKWGFSPKYKGKIKEIFEEIPLKYDLIRECGEKGLLGIMQNNLWGVITHEGRTQIVPQFEVENVENHSFFQKNSPNESLKIDALEEKNNYIYLKLRFQNQLARVRKNGKWGFINTFGNEILPLQYDFVSEIAENMVTCAKDNQILFWDTKNKIFLQENSQLDFSMYKKQVFKNGLVFIKKDGKFGFLDNKGILQIPCKYAQIHNFNENIALVSENEVFTKTTWQIINNKGEKLGEIPEGYELADTQFQGGFLRVKEAPQPPKGEQKNQKGENSRFYYFLDKKGNFLLKEGFFYAEKFIANSALVVNIDKKMGYLSDTGEWFLPDEYEFDKTEFDKQFFLPETQHNLFKVKKNGKCGIVGEKNKVIIPFIYDDLQFIPLKIDQKPQRNLRFIAKKNGKFGVISIKNKIIIPFLYENFYPFAQYLALVQKNGKWGYISEKGQEFWE